MPHRKFFKKAKRMCQESDEGRELLLEVLRGEGAAANLCTWLWRAAGGRQGNMQSLAHSQMGMANFGGERSKRRGANGKERIARSEATSKSLLLC